MATRCQLRFVQRIDFATDDGATESTERTAQIYRHSDGYPEAVLPDLRGLKRLLDRTGTERGPDSTAAQFVFLGKLRAMELYLDREPDRCIRATRPADLLDPQNFEHLNQPMFLLGHGVEDPTDGIHGDEEYLYVVKLPWRGSEVYSGEWTVKVSAHCGFPRWDGPTENAFEEATWQFDGSLSGAIRDVVAEAV